MKLAGFITEMLDVAVNTFVPRVCVVCGCGLSRGERFVCTGCMATLPRHVAGSGVTRELEDSLALSRVDRVVSLMSYVPGTPHARLVTCAKYHDMPALARYMGRIAAEVLRREGAFVPLPDVVVAVPMHYIKRLRRGFNQSDEIAVGVAGVLGLPVADNLVAVRAHSTQTHLGAAGRRENVRQMFAVRRVAELPGLHVLLVDDVITTGATVSAAVEALVAAGVGRVTVMSVAATGRR